MVSHLIDFLCKNETCSPSLRIYPHLQDTGGFFIAVLQKSVTGLKMKK